MSHTLVGMYCYKKIQKRRLKYYVRQASFASADNRMEQELYSRHCLVISNDPGGGEQDTAMTRDRWEQRYAPQGDQTRERHVKFDLSKTSYNSDGSTGEPENVPVVDVAAVARTSSPTITAVLEDRLREANEQYRSLDTIQEYEEEGTCSQASSLSDICFDIDREQYTMEHLMKAGPQFSQFVGLLESIIEEEEEMNDSGDSEVAHTGMTQTTPLTTTQATVEFPYY